MSKLTGEEYRLANYTVKSSFKLGEYDQQYGQRWYCQIEEASMPVMFNTMSEDEVNPDDRLTAETVELRKFKSGKNEGKDYYQLKKVTIEKGKTSQVSAELAQESANDLKQLEQRVKKLEDFVYNQEVAPTEVSDEPIDFSGLPI